MLGLRFGSLPDSELHFGAQAQSLANARERKGVIGFSSSGGVRLLFISPGLDVDPCAEGSRDRPAWAGKLGEPSCPYPTFSEREERLSPSSSCNRNCHPTPQPWFAKLSLVGK